MATPKKSEIVEKAVELFMKDQWRNGTKTSITPTEDELKEGHYFETARQLLMCTNPNLVIVEKNKGETSSEDFEFDVSEALTSGVYTSGTKGTGKTDVNMIIAERLQEEDVTITVFDPSQDWMNRSSIAEYVTVYPHSQIAVPNESVIFDLSLLTPLQAQMKVEEFNRKLFEAQVSNTLRKWVFVIYEEAHQYFRQGCMRAKNMQFSVRLLTQGRNFKIGVGVITQFSSLVDKEAMKFMLQRYFGTTNEPNDVTYLKGFLGKHAEELETLKNGEFLYYHRGNVRHIQIEPFKAYSVPKRLNVLCDSPQSVPEPIKQQQDLSAARLIIALLWFVAIAVGLATMP